MDDKAFTDSEAFMWLFSQEQPLTMLILVHLLNVYSCLREYIYNKHSQIYSITEYALILDGLCHKYVYTILKCKDFVHFIICYFVAYRFFLGTVV